jgi:hypothetical protein
VDWRATCRRNKETTHQSWAEARMVASVTIYGCISGPSWSLKASLTPSCGSMVLKEEVLSLMV